MSPYPVTVALINGHLLSSQPQAGTTTVFRREDLVCLQHYQTFTCQTVGDAAVQRIYQSGVVLVALNVRTSPTPAQRLRLSHEDQHLYLMHAVLAFSAMHMRHLRSPCEPPSIFETYHWQEALQIFVSMLSQPVMREDADAMKATATLVNGIAFALVQEPDPERSWPMSKNHDDLQWLNVQAGIELVSRATRSLVYDSIYEGDDDSNEPDFDFDDYEPPAEDCAGEVTFILSRLERVCNITPFSTVDTNPYHAPFQLLSRLFRMRCTPETVLMYLGFIGSARKEYIDLLCMKDQPAILLLGLWYATICSFDCWWTAARSRIECKSICMYLERSGMSGEVWELLPFLARACGHTLEEVPRSIAVAMTGEENSPAAWIPCQPM